MCQTQHLRDYLSYQKGLEYTNCILQGGNIPLQKGYHEYSDEALGIMESPLYYYYSQVHYDPEW